MARSKYSIVWREIEALIVRWRIDVAVLLLLLLFIHTVCTLIRV